LLIFFEGFLLGLGMIIFIGPVLFQLLSVTLRNGLLPGLSLAFGIFCSDILAVIICFFGSSNFIQSNSVKQVLVLLGSSILIYLGMKSFRSPKYEMSAIAQTDSSQFMISFIKGFLVNFVNPFVFLVWLGVIVYVKSRYQLKEHFALFLSGTLLAILVSDTTKVFLARRLGDLLNGPSRVWIQKCFGLILIAFGLRIFLLIFI
jgi:threonine/homoserine/homoserine lactone efflux protein